MKTLLTLILLCGAAHGQVSMLIASQAASSGAVLVTHSYGESSAGTATTNAVDTTGATFAVCAVSSFTSYGTFSDSKGNTWTPHTSYGPPGTNVNLVRLYESHLTSVGSGHTVSFVHVAIGIACEFFSGMPSAVNFDVENGAAIAGVVTGNPGSITPSQNNSVVVVGVSNGNTSPCDVTVAGYTVTDTTTGASCSAIYGVALAYNIQTTATATNPLVTFAAASDMAATIAAFKP